MIVHPNSTGGAVTSVIGNEYDAEEHQRQRSSFRSERLKSNRQLQPVDRASIIIHSKNETNYVLEALDF